MLWILHPHCGREKQAAWAEPGALLCLPYLGPEGPKLPAWTRGEMFWHLTKSPEGQERSGAGTTGTKGRNPARKLPVTPLRYVLSQRCFQNVGCLSARCQLYHQGGTAAWLKPKRSAYGGMQSAREDCVPPCVQPESSLLSP